MDVRKTKYENQKMIKSVMESNKNAGESTFNKISDEKGIVLNDTLKYLGNKGYKNARDAERKTEEVLKYHNPTWADKQKTVGTSTMFTHKPTKKELRAQALRRKKFEKASPIERSRMLFPVKI